MRPRSLSAVLLFAVLAGCGDPIAEQARVDTRFDPVRADTMLAVAFPPGVVRLDTGQVNELNAMVLAGQRAQHDEFVVVTDGSGGGLQQMRAKQVSQSLSNAGARWVDIATEPAMAMGPDQVVVARSEYRLAARGCPNHSPGTMWNPNESLPADYGCADAFNLGQMMERPRDAAVGRQIGPADATVSATAIQRYREGRVRTAGSASGGAAGATEPGMTGGTIGGGTTGSGSPTSPTY